MAKDVTHNPWSFDATTQAEGQATAGSNFNVKPFVDFVLCKSNGTAGAFTMLDKAGGNTLFDVDTTGTQESVIVPIGKYVDGVYVQALPASGIMYVYHGERA